MGNGNRIAVLTTGGGAPAPIVNALAAAFDDHRVFIEPPESKALFLKRRARRIGWMATAHQFPIMVMGKFAKRFVQTRYREIEDQFHCSFSLDAGVKRQVVTSGNGDDFTTALRDFAPDALMLAGSRMLTKKTLAQITCPVVNFHAGINPKYRGLNGGYWAVVNNDLANYGTTVHYVDAGVDTGDVIAQARFDPSGKDTILTHQHFLSAASASYCVETLRNVLTGDAASIDPDLLSAQYYHPSLTAYIYKGLARGIW
jgi:methionyl-tRNA formyltransferase